MSSTVREVVAVFDDSRTLEDAVFDLETHGFDRAAFSLLASEHAVEKKLGRHYKRIEEMEDAPGAPRRTFFSRASRLEAEYGMAAGLAFAAAILVGASAAPIAIPTLIAAGTGAAVGGVLGRIFHQRYATAMQEQLERGGLLLWVSVLTAEEEKTAVDILKRHAARDVHVHELPA